MNVPFLMMPLVLAGFLFQGCLPDSKPDPVPTLPLQELADYREAQILSKEDRIKKALHNNGAEASGFRHEPYDAEDQEISLPPHESRLYFTVDAVGVGGQVIFCEDQAQCDQVSMYFTALGGLVGPHVFTTVGNTPAVMQLNVNVPDDVAAQFQAALESLE